MEELGFICDYIHRLGLLHFPTDPVSPLSGAQSRPLSSGSHVGKDTGGQGKSSGGGVREGRPAGSPSRAAAHAWAGWTGKPCTHFCYSFKILEMAICVKTYPTLGRIRSLRFMLEFIC